LSGPGRESATPEGGEAARGRDAAGSASVGMKPKLALLRSADSVSAGKTIESYPLRLFAHHMAEVFGVSLNGFYKQESAGAFTWAENRPKIGRKSWSRDRVAQYFAGELRGLTEGRPRGELTRSQPPKLRMAKAQGR